MRQNPAYSKIKPKLWGFSKREAPIFLMTSLTFEFIAGRPCAHFLNIYWTYFPANYGIVAGGSLKILLSLLISSLVYPILTFSPCAFAAPDEHQVLILYKQLENNSILNFQGRNERINYLKAQTDYSEKKYSEKIDF